ncbi:MAG: MarR family winged helix-turn-helix transcriptional regulator [Jiangellaceae bacterium]
MEPELAAHTADLLAQTNRRLRRQAEERLGPLGVTPSQLRTLRVLGRAVEPLRISELARRLDVVPRSATSVVDTLEETGYVRREPDPHDRRATLLVLTGSGKALLDDLGRRRQAGLAELLDRLTPDEQNELVRLLTRLAGPEAG